MSTKKATLNHPPSRHLHDTFFFPIDNNTSLGLSLPKSLDDHVASDESPVALEILDGHPSLKSLPNPISLFIPQLLDRTIAELDSQDTFILLHLLPLDQPDAIVVDDSSSGHHQREREFDVVSEVQNLAAVGRVSIRGLKADHDLLGALGSATGQLQLGGLRRGAGQLEARGRSRNRKSDELKGGRDCRGSRGLEKDLLRRGGGGGRRLEVGDVVLGRGRRSGSGLNHSVGGGAATVPVTVAAVVAVTVGVAAAAVTVGAATVDPDDVHRGRSRLADGRLDRDDSLAHVGSHGACSCRVWSRGVGGVCGGVCLRCG
jgi:hypothetical protein